MRRLITLVALTCIAVLAAPAAFAGTCSCDAQTLIVTPGFSVFNTAVHQPTTTFSIGCNGNATYDMTISTGSSGNYTMRTMLNGIGDTLNYNIYSDTTRSSIWGTTGRRIYSTASGQTTFTDNLYLDFPVSTQDVTASGPLYQDVVTVTLTPVAGTGGATKSCTFTLQTTVTAECRPPAIPPTLDFGNYDPVSAHSTAASPLDQSTALLFNCTKGVNATIQLDQGQHIAAGGGRQLAGPGSEVLSYDLYSNSLRSIPWGNTIPANTVSVTSTSKDVPLGGLSGLLLYGRIPGGQDVKVGSYNDSVTATINY